MKNKPAIRILLFFSVGVIVSNLFRFDVFDLKSEISGWPAWVSVLASVLTEGAGVFLGALLALRLIRYRKPSQMSFFGTSKVKSALLLVIPLMVLTVVGVNNSFYMNTYFYGFIAGTGTFVYCLLEEYGWRGYLQDELLELRSWVRYLLIGSMWYLWHLSFLTNTSIQDNLMFLGILVLASWGIGQVAIATRSVMACASIHFIVNIFTFNQLIKNGLVGSSKWISIVILLVGSVAIISQWNKPVLRKNRRELE